MTTAAAPHPVDRRRRRRRLLATLALLPVLAFAFVVWNHDRPPFDPALLRDLPPGTPRAEVEALLGRPSARTDDDRSWTYARWLAWPMVTFRFDADGRVVEVVFDH